VGPDVGEEPSLLGTQLLQLRQAIPILGPVRCAAAIERDEPLEQRRVAHPEGSVGGRRVRPAGRRRQEECEDEREDGEDPRRGPSPVKIGTMLRAPSTA
jgi:hypothetical protein